MEWKYPYQEERKPKLKHGFLVWSKNDLQIKTWYNDKYTAIDFAGSLTILGGKSLLSF